MGALQAPRHRGVVRHGQPPEKREEIVGLVLRARYKNLRNLLQDRLTRRDSFPR